MILNKVLLIGRLTRDPERRYTPGGMEVADVGFAIAGLKKDETSFIDLTFFGKQVEKLWENCGKGDEILVEGRLVQERWEAQDGTKRSVHKVIVGMFSRSFNDKKQEAAPPPVSYPQAAQPAQVLSSDSKQEPELPF